MASGIDWDIVEQQLLVSPGHDMKGRRKEAYNGMSFVRKGHHLTYSEIEAGVPQLLSGEAADMLSHLGQHDFKAAIKCAYFASCNITPSVRKKPKKHSATCAGDSVDITEFHGVLIAFRQYLEIACVFEEIDQAHIHDHLLSYVEMERSLPLLKKWGIADEEVRVKFQSNWSGEMKFNVFADWCVRMSLNAQFNSVHLELSNTLDSDHEIDAEDAALAVGEAIGIDEASSEEQNKAKALELFMQWDSDNSGCIDEAEFLTILLHLNNSFTKDQVHVLYGAADLSNDGKLQYKEFLGWLFGS